MDRINSKQFIFIVFIMSLSLKVFMLPTYFMRICGGESILVMFVNIGADMLLLFLVVLTMRSAQGSFFEALKEIFGTVLSKVISGVLAAFFLIKLFLFISEIRIFFAVSVFGFPITPVQLIPLLILLIYVSGKKLSTLGRMTDLIMPLVIVSMVTICALTISSVDFSNLLPVGQESDKIVKGITSFPMWFGDFFLLFVFMGKTDTRKRIYFTLIAGGVGLLITALLSAMIFALYSDVQEVLTYGHNISTLTQYSVSSFKYGRFDLLIFCLWLLSALISASIMVNFINRCINYCVGVNIGLYTALVASTGILITCHFLYDANYICELMVKYMTIPAVAVQYGLPLIMVITLYAKRWIRKIKQRKKERMYDKAHST